MANTPVLLTDHRFNLTPGGADDGAYTGTTPVVSDFLIDTASFALRRDLIETSEGQDENEHHRISRNDFDIMFETKLDCGSFSRDLAVTLYPGGGDDLSYAEGAALSTLKFDEVIFSQNNVLADCNPRQDPWPKYRIQKKPWTVTLKKKKSTTGSTNAENLLANNALVGFNFIHSPSSQEIEIDGNGIVEEWNVNYGGGEDLGWTIRPYGAAPTITADNANSLTQLLIANELVLLEMLNDITATALDVSVTGIISMVELAFRPGASTIRFGVRPYGIAPTLGFSNP